MMIQNLAAGTEWHLQSIPPARQAQGICIARYLEGGIGGWTLPGDGLCEIAAGNKVHGYCVQGGNGDTNDGLVLG